MSVKSIVVKAICAVVILSLLGTLIYFLSAPSEEIREEIFTVTSRDAAAIRRIEVVAENSFSFVTEDGVWVPEDMADVGVNRAYVSALGKSMSNLTSPMLTEENASDLAQYGLSNPLREIKLYYENDEEIIKIGNESGAFRFVTVSDTRDVYIVAKSDLYMAFLEKTDFLDLTAVRVDSEKVRKITIGDIVLEQRDGDWYEDAPYVRMADSGQVKALLTSLSDVVAEEILPYEECGLEIAKSSGTMVVIEGDGEETVFYVCEYDEYFSYLMHQGSKYVYRVSNSAVSFVETTGFDLMIKYICPVSISEVKEIKLVSPAKTVILSIDAPSTEAPLFYKDGKQVTEESFRNFYQILMGLTVKGEGRASGAAEYAITITKESGDVSDVRFISAGDMEYAVSIDGKTQFVIAKKSVADVFEYLRDIKEV